jgi:acyl dehydratase
MSASLWASTTARKWSAAKPRAGGDDLAMRTLTGIEGIKAAAGEDLGVSGWYDVTQEGVDAFADVTGDHQWIHVDPERAKETPFGGTIAHGYYTLSLSPRLAGDMYAFEGIAFGVNYGVDRVRFPAPLPVGSRVRMRTRLSRVTDVDGGIQLLLTQTFEREASDKPVCVAEMIVRLYA